MADDAVTVTPAGDEGGDDKLGAPITGPVGLDEARAARAAKKAAAREGLAKMHGVPTPEIAPTLEAAKPVAATTAAKPAEPKPIGVTVTTKSPPEPGDEKPDDPATAKGIDAIEKRAIRAREQLAKDKADAKAELDAERAELARQRAATAKDPTLEELQKLAKTPGKTLELLKRLGVESEDDYERVARDTYAVSKSGKADPKNKVHADQMAEKQGLHAELADLRKAVEETRTYLTTREQQAHVATFQKQYLDEAVKAVPTEPSFIGNALAANPEKAREKLLALGQRMEREAMQEDGATKYDPSYTPTHAEVIARYEKDRIAEYKDDGLTDEQIAALIAKKPIVAAAPAKKPPATLDVNGARPTTPTINGTGIPTRAEKMAIARAERIKRNASPS